jgi:diguanylate cyclase (GGDEF)-like protein
MKLTIQLLLTLVISLALTTGVYAQDDSISLEELEQLPPIPAEYGTLSYLEKVNWLNERLNEDINVVEEYRLQRMLAFEYDDNGEPTLTNSICESHPPQSFDFYYRYTCLAVDDLSYEQRISKLFELHEKLLEEGWVEFAVSVLAEIGWMQSSSGNIKQAFQSFEQALSLAKDQRVPWLVLNGVMQDTATLYIMYGDANYRQKGMQLHKHILERTKALRDDNQLPPEHAQNTIDLTYFNLGVANALHERDYEKALDWLGKVNLEQAVQAKSALVFSALSAVELGKAELAANYLDQSAQLEDQDPVVERYLACYQQLVNHKLNNQDDVPACHNLHPDTQLEVKLDVYKRMSELESSDLRIKGHENFYQLYKSTLQNQLKQSSSAMASSAELSRLQLESELQKDLLEKEELLKDAERERRETQSNLMYAIIAIFILVVVFGLLQIRQKLRQAKRFKALSQRDSLTGLHNRLYFEGRIQRELDAVNLANREEDNKRLAVYLFDIDYFKKLNDSYGHDIGDEVLKEFARRVTHALREQDMLVRWGGEEFLVVAKVDDEDDFHNIAQRIHKAVTQKPFILPNGLELPVTCTVGGVICPYLTDIDQVPHWRTLVQLADTAMYYGKSQGRNRWVCINEIPTKEVEEKVLNEGFKSLDKHQGVKLKTSNDQ